MQRMKFFIDTHDRNNGTFPESISKAELGQFLAKYEKACREEGVVMVRVHAGLEDGVAYCLNMAPDADAVKRAHAKVGLPFDRITEVSMSSPGDLYFGAA